MSFHSATEVGWIIINKMDALPLYVEIALLKIIFEDNRTPTLSALANEIQYEYTTLQKI